MWNWIKKHWKNIVAFLIGLGLIILSVFIKRSKLKKWLAVPIFILLSLLGGYSIYESTQENPFEPPQTFAAGGDVTFNDTFTDTSGTDLDAHSPDTGDSWTQVDQKGGSACPSANDPNLEISASNTLTTECTDGTNAGTSYTADATYATSSYQVKMDCTDCGDNDEYVFSYIRATGATIDSAYTVWDIHPFAGDDPKLSRVTSNTGCSTLQTFNNGESWTEGPVIDDGDTVILQALVDEILFCDDTDKVCPLYVTDTNITAAGEAGVGMGAFPCAVGGDLAPADQEIDNFQAIEVGDTQQGWNDPTTTGENNSDWTSASNAFASDGSDATSNTPGNLQDYGDFGFTTSDIETVRGIMVKIEWAQFSPFDWGVIDVEISNDNGSTYSTAGWSMIVDGNTDTEVVFGHAQELWGLTWAAGDLADSDFRVRIDHQEEQDTSVVIHVDHISVKIVYDATEAVVDNNAHGQFQCKRGECKIERGILEVRK